MRRKMVLITGASDGIGLALARLLQGSGARVVSVGRRPDVDVAPQLRGDYCRIDLAQPFAAAVVAEFLRRREAPCTFWPSPEMLLQPPRIGRELSIMQMSASHSDQELLERARSLHERAAS